MNTKFAVLALLATNAGRLLTHRFILENVWGASHKLEKQYVRAYIYRPRSKLEDEPDSPARLLGIPGFGHLLTDGIKWPLHPGTPTGATSTHRLAVAIQR